MHLEIPKGQGPVDGDGAATAALTKCVFAAILAGVEVRGADVQGPTLVGGETPEKTPENIFKKLSSADLAPVFALSSLLEPFVASARRIDSETAAKIVPELPDPSSPGFEAAFLFGDFYALVSRKGKLALSAQLELTMWYQRMLGGTRVKQVLAAVGAGSAGATGARVVSGASGASPASAGSVSSGSASGAASKSATSSGAASGATSAASTSSAPPPASDASAAATPKTDAKAAKPEPEAAVKDAAAATTAAEAAKKDVTTAAGDAKAEAKDAAAKDTKAAELETNVEAKDAKVEAKDSKAVGAAAGAAATGAAAVGAAEAKKDKDAKVADKDVKPATEAADAKAEKPASGATGASEAATASSGAAASAPASAGAAAGAPATASGHSAVSAGASTASVPLYHPPTHPILPSSSHNILITSALPYVNNVPHLGNIIGSTLSADFFARYTKLRGINSLYICGTDEYGTATETKAIEDGVTPLELCTKFHHIHKQVYDWFQIEFDHFGRTSTPQQTKIAQEVFLEVQKNGFLEEQSMEQLYCAQHKGYLADRFVEGTCPKCGYDDARGDQCDSCGVLLDAFELLKPRCKLDGATPERRETKHMFISLDKLQPEVEKFAQSRSKGWSRNAVAITNTWLKGGLQPRAITRDLKWGVPVPVEGYEDKVLYVWFDAPIGYPSITACYTDEWKQWWHNPEKVDLYQFMGKDNVPFHTVIFPATEIASKQGWTMLKHLSTTEYLQYEGGKFSKSRNLGVFGNNAQEIGVSPSVWRYYLACARPETADTQFSWEEFVVRNNSELLANFGNFVNRVVKFTIAKFGGVVPAYSPQDIDVAAFTTDINALLEAYNSAMTKCELREGVEILMRISSRGNLFLQDNKLDNSLLENEPRKCAALIGTALSLIYVLSAVASPFMPETGTKILEQLQLPARLIPDRFDFGVPGGHKLGPAQYLFVRIDKAKIAEWQKKFGGEKQEEEQEKKKKKKSKKKKKATVTATEGTEGAGAGASKEAAPKDAEAKDAAKEAAPKDASASASKDAKESASTAAPAKDTSA